MDVLREHPRDSLVPRQLTGVRVTLFATVAVALALAVGAGAARAINPTLYVTYSANCTFTLTDDSGKKVTSISPGAYQVFISTPTQFRGDFTPNSPDFHNCNGNVQFSLTGPGVNLATTLTNGDDTSLLFSETFSPSASYAFVDGNQPSVTRVTVSTTASGSPVAPTGPVNTSPSKAESSADIIDSAAIKATAFRGSLDAIVYKSGKLTLSRNGKKVSSLKAGKWTFAVDDESPKAGFDVQVLNGKPQVVTTGGFVGSHNLTISLKLGRWSFFSAGGKKSTFFVVS